jgi:hypothetical protein
MRRGEAIRQGGRMPTTSTGRPAPPPSSPSPDLRGQLDRLRVVDLPALHDRRLPRSRTAIDHVLVTAAGVWVLDAQKVCGPLTFAVRGRPGPRQALLLQGRVHSTLLSRMHEREDGVRKALADAGAAEVPVRSALCFVHARPTPGLVPVQARGVLVTWSDQLDPIVLEQGPYDTDDRAAVHRVLDRALPRR